MYYLFHSFHVKEEKSITFSDPLASFVHIRLLSLLFAVCYIVFCAYRLYFVSAVRLVCSFRRLRRGFPRSSSVVGLRALGFGFLSQFLTMSSLPSIHRRVLTSIVLLTF
ncbi:hypothetical protein AcV7_003098 [Taiwanofungus camphoratus]|nr:hypothetical protein AcV7_003098 [Antrodia cinnamomea]